ncbi:MAG: hypothetical protein E6R07_01440 [Nevskiaceae bacterium]|nr:MAG: hypothetical protein E6R07_01440 [Nevskiaceae bacterium]
MSRQLWIIFLAVQLIGELGFWFWPLLGSYFGPAAWVAGMTFLLPGNQLSALLIEHFFWTTLTLTQQALVELPIEIAINAAVWLVVTNLLRILFRRSQKNLQG